MALYCDLANQPVIHYDVSSLHGNQVSRKITSTARLAANKYLQKELYEQHEHKGKNSRHGASATSQL
jgi:hypothetical protein